MNIAFTICSNNYLAHAKTLGDSFLKFHPEMKFFIGLVDKICSDFDYTLFSKFTIITVDEIGVPFFDELNHKYNITELNTAVKPAYLQYIFNNYGPDKLLYIDPDILVVSRFEEVLDALNYKNIVLTPHICTPIDDEFGPTDFHTLRGGVFNLGFIGLSNHLKVKDFIKWWHDRVVKYGYGDFNKNMFYDQLWINYVPAFYENYFILKHLGYNMANWNLHERYLNQNPEERFFVNNEIPLRFFHFSSYKYDKPDVICSYLTRFNFNSRSDLVSLFSLYNNLLRENKVEEINNLPIFYYQNIDKNKSNSTIKSSIFQNIGFRIFKAGRILVKGF